MGADSTASFPGAPSGDNSVMKLASYKDGSRDGQLVVVSRDLTRAQYATGVATRLQQVLDDWNFLAPQLQEVAEGLERGRSRHAFDFDPALCMAPLPRAPRRVVAASYLPHVERWCAGLGVPVPARLKSEPLWSHRACDLWLGPRDDMNLPAGQPAWDVEPQLTLICGDLHAGASADQALESVRLLALTADGVDRTREADQQRRGWGGVLERGPALAAPVAVTPDELGAAWSRGRASLDLELTVEGVAFGAVDLGGSQFHAGQLLALLVRDRPWNSGSMLSLGVPAVAGATGPAACLLDRREQERAASQTATTPWLRDGDHVQVTVRAEGGRFVFGTIDAHMVQSAE